MPNWRSHKAERARRWIIQGDHQFDPVMVVLSCLKRRPSLTSPFYFSKLSTYICIFDNEAQAHRVLDRVRPRVNPTARIKLIDQATARLLAMQRPSKPWPPAKPRIGLKDRERTFPPDAEKPFSLRDFNKCSPARLI